MGDQKCTGDFHAVDGIFVVAIKNQLALSIYESSFVGGGEDGCENMHETASYNRRSFSKI